MTMDWVSKGERVQEFIGRGRAFSAEIDALLRRLIGMPVGKEGLAQLFQPGYWGVRSFVVQARVTTNRFVEFLVLGIARDGAPIWSAQRSLGFGRDGSLEIHHGRDQISPEYRSLNILVDCLDNELRLLKTLDLGPNARITFDAHGVGTYLAALHGFVFADATDDGPPMQSIRALEPDGDRTLLIDAAKQCLAEYAERQGLDENTLNKVLRDLDTIQDPQDLAQLDLIGSRFDLPDQESDFAKPTGRALCLDERLPSWRAALYPSDEEQAGDRFRQQHKEDSERRRAEEIRTSVAQLHNSQRSVQIKALRALGRSAPSWMLPEVKSLFEHSHRGVAVVARQVARQINEIDFHERIFSFANNKKNEGQLRGHAYRVLCEYYPKIMENKLAMLRINPDARIQRSIIPLLVSDQNAGPKLASLLAANPRSRMDCERSGLDEMRLEIIDCLSRIDDSRSIPALMAALATQPSPPPREMLALSRALVSHPDPRARPAISLVSERLDRPLVP